ADMENAGAVIPADVVTDYGAQVAEVLVRVPFAGRADEHESAFVIVAVVVLENGVARIEVGIEALAVERGSRQVSLVQLEQRVIGAPGPDTGVVAPRAPIAIARDVVFDQGGVSRPRHDAVAPDVVHKVVADDYVQ